MNKREYKETFIRKNYKIKKIQDLRRRKEE